MDNNMEAEFTAIEVSKERVSLKSEDRPVYTDLKDIEEQRIIDTELDGTCDTSFPELKTDYIPLSTNHSLTAGV